MAKKEQHFFGSDLAEEWPQPTAKQYFDSFAGSESASRRGEGSGWYLWSRFAAKEIHTYNSRARIIVMLRNPIDMLPSLHSQYLHDEMENLKDIKEALEAENDRRNGRRIPPNNSSHPWRLFYVDVVRFYEQLERYYDVFGRAQVHVVLFDDFVGDLESTYREVLEFLQVDPTFMPSFRVMNPNKRTRSPLINRFLLNPAVNQSSWMRRVGTRIIPIHALRSAILKHLIPAATRLNTSFASRDPVDMDLRSKLAVKLAPDIDRLGELLKRDLTHWYSDAMPRAFTSGSNSPESPISTT